MTLKSHNFSVPLVTDRSRRFFFFRSHFLDCFFISHFSHAWEATNYTLHLWTRLCTLTRTRKRYPIEPCTITGLRTKTSLNLRKATPFMLWKNVTTVGSSARAKEPDISVLFPATTSSVCEKNSAFASVYFSPKIWHRSVRFDRRQFSSKKR